MQKASFDIIQNYQLLMIRPIGAWSEDKALAFTQAANRYLTNDEYRFAGLIDLRQWGLGRITPSTVDLIQTDDPIQVRQVCAARHYEYDHTELLQFLTI